MRKWALSLGCMIALLLTGCGGAATPSKPITETFSCRFSATCGELAFGGTMQRAAAGMLTVKLLDPPALDGLTLSWDGQQATVTLGLLKYTMDSELPQAASMKLTLDVLDALFRDKVTGTKTEDGALFIGEVNGLEYHMLTDASSGTLLLLEIPDIAFSLQFSEFRKGV